MLMRVGHRSDRGALSDAGSTATITSRGVRLRMRRRDRRGRGVRGPLAPQAVPVSRSRATQFDEQVLFAWDRLVSVRPELGFIEIAVSDVPEPDNPCLAHFDPADAGLPARITVYRWALELRAGSPVMLYALIGDVLAEQAAAFLAIDPALLDAKYPRA
ncbi:MAG: metallopeptidase family protein [Candidatus Nanopelagicales bacterium]|nr:metallopeptidase family protein [Candidatus Nanopelagicales bacterium]HPE11277.1 metallopeptidase family protein [Actinomycetota bacterium]HRV66416.1 metallopeptidase family protein [Candidatus Nanopelagicales bacterium]